ncbi:MAG: hypothetical protein CME17_06885 [Gemmatimonadetes bacterium]|nr:hypothetical protein [Gemmatimonadota bacterium]|tara:strand:+ start:6924 stop:8285 length:1362 start_codon:yes stop_codon:yes gene_type:complete
MGRTLLKTRSDIITDLINTVVARTSLTDVNDASAIKNLLMAVGDEIFTVYGQFTNLASLFDFQTAEGEDLDERAKEILGGTLIRNGAARAVGTLTFGRAVAGVLVNIPSGTVATTADGLQFRTTVAGTIGAADLDSLPISATAVTAGSAGNVAVATITALSTKPPGVQTVTNTANFSGGADRETDAAFRARIEDFVQSLARCTVDGIESAVLGVTDTGSGKTVQFVHVYEPPVNPGTAIVFIDDGAGTAATSASVVGETLINPALGGEEFLYTDNKPLLDDLDGTFTLTIDGVAQTLGIDYYVNWASGRVFFTTPLLVGVNVEVSYQYYTDLIAEAQRVVDGDPADRVNYPGYRAAGVDVRVLSPSIRTIIVTAVLTVLEGFDEATVVANVESNIIDYINNLGISGDVIRAEIIERTMATPGVYNVNLTTPALDITINDDELPRTSSAEVTVS